MSWFIESYSMQTDELLADYDLDVLAAATVERLIGTSPEVLTPDQIRVVAPLFDIRPDQWESVTGSSPVAGVFEPGWLSTALVYMVGRLVGESSEDLVGVVFRIPSEVAQGLLDRFSAGVHLPDGETFIGFYGPELGTSSA